MRDFKLTLSFSAEDTDEARAMADIMIADADMTLGGFGRDNAVPTLRVCEPGNNSHNKWTRIIT